MSNSFHHLEEAILRDFKIPPEIEERVVGQVESFSHFANVVELFGANPIQTFLKMSGGKDSNTNDNWRKKTPSSGSINDQSVSKRFWITSPKKC